MTNTVSAKFKADTYLMINVGTEKWQLIANSKIFLF